MPVRFRIGIIGFAIYSPVIIAQLVYQQVIPEQERYKLVATNFWHMLISIEKTMWISLQWQFAGFYLRAAFLFRKTFMAVSDSDFERVRRRKSLAFLLESVVQTTLFGYMIVYIGLIYTDKSTT